MNIYQERPRGLYRAETMQNETSLWHFLCLFIVICSFTNGLFAESPETIPDGYRADEIPTPEGVTFEISGMDFHPHTGALYVTTRYGDVWTYEEGSWSKFAEGLHDPTGLYITDDGRILVGHKPEVTRLIDDDQDGYADVYRSINDSWGLSRNYCEYTHGPVQDRKGNLFVTLNLSDLAGKDGHPGRVKGAVMGHNAKYRGWCVRITPDGKMDPYAYGLRSPAGIGISPEDEVFVTTNQGDWMPFSGLAHIRRDRFYGHPASLKDLEKFKDRNLDEIPNERYDRMRTKPVLWFPYSELAQSPGNPVWDTTQGSFGPFHGQIFVGDQIRANVMRIALEKVKGRYQGAVFNFVEHLDSGALRLTFGPDGDSLWVGQTDRGWRSVGDERFSLHRIQYDGSTVPFSMHHIRLTPDGFMIQFTKPVDRSTAEDPKNYTVSHWGYKYSQSYGSPKVNRTEVGVQSVSVEEQDTRIRLSLKADLRTDRIYKIQLSDITSKSGEKPAVNSGYYTVNRLREPSGSD